MLIDVGPVPIRVLDKVIVGVSELAHILLERYFSAQVRLSEISVLTAVPVTHVPQPVAGVAGLPLDESMAVLDNPVVADRTVRVQLYPLPVRAGLRKVDPAAIDPR